MKKKIIYTAVLAAALGLAATGAVAQTSGDPAVSDAVPITGPARGQAPAAARAEVGEGTVTETETGDDGAAYEVEITKNDGTEVDVELDESFNVLSVEDDSDDNDDLEGEHDDDADEVPLTGPELERATQAALAEVGAGTVTESEVEDSGFELEVTLDDGTEVEVELDDSFNVISVETDDE